MLDKIFSTKQLKDITDFLYRKNQARPQNTTDIYNAFLVNPSLLEQIGDANILPSDKLEPLKQEVGEEKKKRILAEKVKEYPRYESMNKEEKQKVDDQYQEKLNFRKSIENIGATEGSPAKLNQLKDIGLSNALKLQLKPTFQDLPFPEVSSNSDKRREAAEDYEQYYNPKEKNWFSTIKEKEDFERLRPQAESKGLTSLSKEDQEIFMPLNVKKITHDEKNKSPEAKEQREKIKKQIERKALEETDRKKHLQGVTDSPDVSEGFAEAVADVNDESKIEGLSKAYRKPLDETLKYYQDKHKKYITELAPLLANRFYSINSPGTTFHSGNESYEKRLIDKANKGLMKQTGLLAEKDERARELAYQHQSRNLESADKKANNLLLTQNQKILKQQAFENQKARKDADFEHQLDKTQDLYENQRKAEQHEYDTKKYKTEEGERKEKEKQNAALSVIKGYPITIEQKPQEPNYIRSGPSSSLTKTIGQGLMSMGGNSLANSHFGDQQNTNYPQSNNGYDYRYPNKKGGRIHRADGGVLLNNAVMNARVNHLNPLQSLKNLEAARRLQIETKKREALKAGGSPIEVGSRLAKEHALQDAALERANQLEREGYKGSNWFKGLVSSFLGGMAQDKESALGQGAAGAFNAFKEKNAHDQAQSDRLDKAAALRQSILKEMRTGRKEDRALDQGDATLAAQIAHHGDQREHNKMMASIAHGKVDALRGKPPKFAVDAEGAFTVAIDPKTGEPTRVPVKGSTQAKVNPIDNSLNKKMLESDLKPDTFMQSWLGNPQKEKNKEIRKLQSHYGLTESGAIDAYNSGIRAPDKKSSEKQPSGFHPAPLTEESYEAERRRILGHE